jgi:outer membrane protein OmpA-like peptidoglycan-associated protein
MLTRSYMTALAFAAFMSVSGLHAATAGEPPSGTFANFIYFPTGDKTLDDKDHDRIAAIAKMMQTTPELFATVVGKTDTVGSMEYNNKLSERRADAVFEALVYDNKIDSSRIRVCWTGEHLPFLDSADQEAESRNRLVAIIVSKEMDPHFCYR